MGRHLGVLGRLYLGVCWSFSRKYPGNGIHDSYSLQLWKILRRDAVQPAWNAPMWHWENSHYNSFHIEWDMIVVTVFFLRFWTKKTPFGSKSKGKLLPRSYPIQCERKWKYSFLSVKLMQLVAQSITKTQFISTSFYKYKLIYMYNTV